MSIQAWNVLAAPLVKWKPEKDVSEWLVFSHVRTGVTDVGTDGCARGFTLWTGNLDGNPVFMAFDWVELRPGVPILTDPNAVLTNLSVMNAHDERETKLREVVHLTVMICELGWQDAALVAARDYLDKPRQQAMTADLRRGAEPAADAAGEQSELRKAA